MKKIDWEPVKDVVEVLCGVAVYGLVVAASNKMADRIIDAPDSTTVGYNDAVKAIMKSGMYSHDKTSAAVALKCNADSEFYKAVIHIANDSGSYSHDKVDMIKALSRE